MEKYSPFIFSVLILFLAAGCTDSTTTPEEEEIQETGFVVIDYTVDAASASSGEITPSGGGTVIATGSNGVEFRLAVSPGAVDAAITVTISPFSYLSITDGNSGIPDTTECQQGALFEPTGQTFDSTAVLTITFPQSGVDCDLDGDYRIISIDSASTFYEILPTLYTGGVSALCCTLTHFSGYGTDDPGYDRLKNLIDAASIFGSNFPTDQIISILSGYAEDAQLRGWDDLADLAVEGIHDVFDKLADIDISYAESNPSAESLQDLLVRTDQAQGWGFTDVEDKLKAAIDSVIRSIAAQGRALCLAGDHEGGRALLFFALEYAQGGFVQDPEFQSIVSEWLTDCGAVTIELSADKSLIYDYALTEDDTRTFVTFEATVRDFNGDPMEDVEVVLVQEPPAGTSHTAAKAVPAIRKTDELGLTGMRYTYGAAPFNLDPEGTHMFRAMAWIGGEPIYSEYIPVELRRARITIGYSYTYTEWSDWSAECNVSAFYNVNGVTTSSGLPSCAYVSRGHTTDCNEYGSDWWSTYHNELIDDPKVTLCSMVSDGYKVVYTNDDIRSRITVLISIGVSIGKPTGGNVAFEWTYSYKDPWIGTTYQDLYEGYDAWPEEGYGVVFISDAGSFEPFHFEDSYSSSNEVWNGVMDVTVSIE
jgi:hypothetical protein